MFSNKNYRRWFIQGTLGILIFGSGLCVLLEAAFFKHADPPTLHWIGFGTGALIIVMAGLVLLVNSIKYRIRYEMELPIEH